MSILPDTLANRPAIPAVEPRVVVEVICMPEEATRLRDISLGDGVLRSECVGNSSITGVIVAMTVSPTRLNVGGQSDMVSVVLALLPIPDTL